MSRVSNTCTVKGCRSQDPFCEREGCDAVFWPRVLELERFDAADHDANIASAQKQLARINRTFTERMEAIQEGRVEGVEDITFELDTVAHYSEIISRYSNIISKLTAAKERDGREFRSEQRHVRQRYELSRSEDELRVEGIVLFCRIVWSVLSDMRTDDMEKYLEIKETLIEAQRITTAGLVDIMDVQPGGDDDLSGSAEENRDV